MLDREPVCTEPIKNRWEAGIRDAKDEPALTGGLRTRPATPLV